MGETISLDIDFPQVESQIEVQREHLVDELWAEYSHLGLQGKVQDCISEKVPDEVESYIDNNYDLNEFVTEDDLGDKVQSEVIEWLKDVVRLEPENLCEVGEKFSAAVAHVVKGMEIECKCADNNISADKTSNLTLSARKVAVFQAIEAEVLSVKAALRNIRDIIGSEVQI